MNKHIQYIDGLKGFCALCVIIYHYILAFDFKGYVGWNSGIAPHDSWSHFWSYFPLSFISNASYVLFMFFAIIAFIPATVFFQNKNAQWIKKQALIRYFRFVPYTFVLILASYFISSQGWYYHLQLGEVLQEPWNTAVLSQNMKLEAALWSGLFGAMMVGAGEYISSLWCMHIIFIGSYFSYAVLLFFGKMQHRTFIYLFLWILLSHSPIYVFFLVGIMAADMHIHLEKELTHFQQKALFCVGLICVCIGEAPWSTINMGQSFGLGTAIPYILQSLGIFSLLLSICQNQKLQSLLNHKIFLHCARYCFEYITVHILILFSLSAWIFIEIHALLGYTAACIISLITAIPLNYFGAVACGKALQPLAATLSQKAYSFFIPEK